jgi:hypothetical protein
MPNSRPIAKKTGSSDSEDKLRGEDVQDQRQRKSSHRDRPSPVIVATRSRGCSSDFIRREVKEEDESNTPEEEPTNKILPQSHHR